MKRLLPTAGTDTLNRNQPIKQYKEESEEEEIEEEEIEEEEIEEEEIEEEAEEKEKKCRCYCPFESQLD